LIFSLERTLFVKSLFYLSFIKKRPLYSVGKRLFFDLEAIMRLNRRVKLLKIKVVGCSNL